MRDLLGGPSPKALNRLAACGLLWASLLAHPAMALDITAMWDFGNPALSEQRFRDALNGASADEALILQTQIARSYGLRNETARAREILTSISTAAKGASPEARVRYALELGRTWASAAHSPKSQTPETRDTARRLYTEAFETARDAKLDYLAIDALHMMAFVDTEPAAQLAWDLKALAYMEASAQAEAKRWEGSLRNNIGYALHQQGRYDEAMLQLRLALAAREREGKPDRIREAWWMIAWTLHAQGKHRRCAGDPATAGARMGRRRQTGRRRLRGAGAALPGQRRRGARHRLRRETAGGQLSPCAAAQAAGATIPAVSNWSDCRHAAPYRNQTAARSRR